MTAVFDKRTWASLNSADGVVAVNRGSDVIAVVWSDDDSDENANARLIAAAPELLEAAKAILKLIDEDSINALIRAVAKAESAQ